MTKTVESILNSGKAFLKDKGIESYSIDAQLLLMYAAGMSKIQLYTKSAELLSDNIIRKYKDYLEERGRSKPVSYIINHSEFMSLDFYVDGTVLIPRPETELLVEKAIYSIKEKGYKTVLEIGTGSGCIAVSILYYVKKLYMIASDISKVALETARKNAESNGCGNIAFVQSDLFENIDDNVKADIIISNPPYIESHVIESLSPDVKNYEPLHALDGGESGLDFYEAVISKAENYLTDGGMILFEVGYNQGEAVKELLCGKGFTNVEIIKDLSGRDRVVLGNAVYIFGRGVL